MEPWDFYPKWILEFDNGDIVKERPLMWRYIPKMTKDKNSRLKRIYLEWENGLIESVPQSSYYYFAYRLAETLSGALRAHSKVFGHGDDPSNLKAFCCRSDGLCAPETIVNAKPPFLLII
jgi:hypothetical protein